MSAALSIGRELSRNSQEIVNAAVVSQSREHSDAAALDELPTEDTNLPWIVLRAAFRASRTETLSARARATLAALARTADAKRPYAAIFAGRALLTGRSGLSERTFYRGLADLESAGLIRRAAQLRIATEGYEGRFGRAHLHLTELAAMLLGLVEPAPVPSAVQPAKPYAAGAKPSGTGADDAHDAAFPEPTATVADGAIYKDLSPGSFQKRQPGQVPADLERLRSLGFHDFLIFRLMREAREAGKRLSDVVQVCWHGLKKAERPICYLRALLRSNVDFRYQAMQRSAEQTAKRDADAERDAANTLVLQMAGQVFVDAKGEQLLEVDADGQGAAIQSTREGTVRRSPSTWAQAFARGYHAGHWRLADSADREAFAQARYRHTAVVARPDSAPRMITEVAREAMKALMAATRAHRRA
jgi:hypothetical protein